MSAIRRQATQLSLSEKFTRLRLRMRDPEWRRYGRLLLTGKVLGVGLTLMTMFVVTSLFFSHVFAQTGTPEVKAADIVNPVNTVWTLVAAFLVFGMQVGFTMLEAGFCRSRETVNVLMECVVDTCLCGILFYAFGFAFMFSHGNGFIGYHWFFLQDAPATYETTGVAFLAVWLFQFAFADTCSTITSGAMIGRTGFVGDLLYSFARVRLHLSDHRSLGLGTGWLAGTDGQRRAHFLPSLGMGFHDFAGSTVVHTIGGFIALAGAIVLGPRLGRKFKRDGGGPMLPHDLTIAVSRRLDPVVRLVRIQSWQHALRDGFRRHRPRCRQHHAGRLRRRPDCHVLRLTCKMKKWDASFTVNGFLAGLVAITCPCYWVSPTGSVLLGGIAGVLVIVAVDVLEYLRIDDPIGAVPVHGICGIWGTLSLGLFACGQYGVDRPARSGQLGAADRPVLRRRIQGA